VCAVMRESKRRVNERKSDFMDVFSGLWLFREFCAPICMCGACIVCVCVGLVVVQVAVLCRAAIWCLWMLNCLTNGS
jgi:hypothetical protein